MKDNGRVSDEVFDGGRMQSDIGARSDKHDLEE